MSALTVPTAVTAADGLRRLADRIEATGVPARVRVGVFVDSSRAAEVAALLAVPGTEMERIESRSERPFVFWDQAGDGLAMVTVYGPPIEEVAP